MMRRDWRELVTLAVDSGLLVSNGTTVTARRAAELKARITVDGYVAPCVTLPVKVGNLREQRFADIWRDSPFLHKLRDRSNIQIGNCATCELKSSCGGCRAVSMGFYGDAFAGDPYCWITPETGAWPQLPLATIAHQPS